MTRGIFLTLVWAASVFGTVGYGSTLPEVSANLSAPRMQGSTTARLVAFPLYYAELWVPGGQSYPKASKFALTLRYKYNFSSKILANASVREMSRMSGKSLSAYSALEAKLAKCFADVTPKDRFTGVSEGQNAVSFYFNGTKRCTVNQPDISKQFFDIWLGPKTRDQAGAARLAGKN